MTSQNNEVKVGLIVLGVVVAALLLLTLTTPGCTNDEQQEAIERNKRVEAQEAQDKADADKKAAEAAAQTPAPAETAAPEPEQTPEAPAEPEQVDVYYYNGSTCLCHAENPCGSSFWKCQDKKVYECRHDVVYSLGNVDKTDDNDVNCN